MRSLRLRILILLAIVVPVGLALSRYAGPGRWWLNNWGASVAYEIFFMSLALLAIGRASALPNVALGVCAATIALEFLQLWTPPWLTAVRSTFVGRAVLGNSFSWLDMPAYPVGCAVGWLLLRRIARGAEPSHRVKATPVGSARIGK